MRAIVAKALSRFHCDIAYTMESACSDILSALRPSAHGEHQGKPTDENYVPDSDLADMQEAGVLAPAQGKREATGTDDAFETLLKIAINVGELKDTDTRYIADLAHGHYGSLIAAQSARLAEVERESRERLALWEATELERNLARDARDRYMKDALAAEQKLKEVEDMLTSLKHTVVATIGGKVEGQPTHEGNYLQRLRELLSAEILAGAALAANNDLRAQLQQAKAANARLAESRDAERSMKNTMSNHYNELGATIDALRAKLQQAKEERA
jgi:hypothetical protein